MSGFFFRTKCISNSLIVYCVSFYLSLFFFEIATFPEEQQPKIHLHELYKSQQKLSTFFSLFDIWKYNIFNLTIYVCIYKSNRFKENKIKSIEYRVEGNIQWFMSWNGSIFFFFLFENVFCVQWVIAVVKMKLHTRTSISFSMSICSHVFFNSSELQTKWESI